MQPSGAFVIDLGGGTVDMAVISQGAMSQSESLKVGGNDLDAEIVKFLREEHNVAVGLRTAEEIKRTVACALPREEDVTTYAKGQDLLTGRWRSAATLCIWRCNRILRRWRSTPGRCLSAPHPS